jgi:hypothetical protein
MYPYYPYYVNPAHDLAYVNNYHYVRHYPNYFLNPFPYPYYQIRSYPQVNPTVFMDSATKMQVLIQDALLVLRKISASKQFSTELMSAAQQSNKEKVNRMIRSAGVKNIPQVTFTPTGIHLRFFGDVTKVDCCHLILDLRWE